MNFLPPEVQLDIFKCLNFTQLLNVQQTNFYFKNFINEYEDELARKKCHKLLFSYIHWKKLYHDEFFKPEPKLYDFELSEELENKWKYGIKKSIPLYFSDNSRRMHTAICSILDRESGQVLNCNNENLFKMLLN
uniref:F-box domain-containing protein n=1 Tax=Meloidogyne enterolobii TaxID=390850 RepID=A0A6V7UDQ1_MELEN|nr:unnamed protein product [Meloidogyne enterolobii]